MARTGEDVARIAEYICECYDAGNRGGIQKGKIHFELDEVGRCSEFVRECVEAAAESVSHGALTTKYFGGNARQTEQKMKAAGVQIPVGIDIPFDEVPRRGDVVCFNSNAGKHGHIGICLGDSLFAENTSSTRRGPGFVVSSLVQMRHRMSGFYRLFSNSGGGSVVIPAHEVMVVDYVSGNVLGRMQVVKNGWHPEQSKVYVTDVELR